MRSDEFVNLHVHTEYSLLDGACRIKNLISRVKELGQTSVAITDHGNMYGAVEFWNAARDWSRMVSKSSMWMWTADAGWMSTIWQEP